MKAITIGSLLAITVLGNLAQACKMSPLDRDAIAIQEITKYVAQQSHITNPKIFFRSGIKNIRNDNKQVYSVFFRDGLIASFFTQFDPYCNVKVDSSIEVIPPTGE